MKNRVKVKMHKDIWTRLQLYVEECPVEIQLIGITKDYHIGSGEYGVIVEKLLPLFEQVCTAGHVTVDEKKRASEIYKMYPKLSERPEIGFMMHSHANLGVFWSGEDETEIWGSKDNDQTRGWSMSKKLVSVVMNKKGEYKARFDQFTPYHLSTDDCDLSLFETMEELEDLHQKTEEAIASFEVNNAATTILTMEQINSIKEMITKNLRSEYDAKKIAIIREEVKKEIAEKVLKPAPTFPMYPHKLGGYRPKKWDFKNGKYVEVEDDEFEDDMPFAMRNREFWEQGGNWSGGDVYSKGKSKKLKKKTKVTKEDKIDDSEFSGLNDDIPPEDLRFFDEAFEEIVGDNPNMDANEEFEEVNENIKGEQNGKKN